MCIALHVDFNNERNTYDDILRNFSSLLPVYKSIKITYTTTGKMHPCSLFGYAPKPLKLIQ